MAYSYIETWARWSVFVSEFTIMMPSSKMIFFHYHLFPKLRSDGLAQHFYTGSLVYIIFYVYSVSVQTPLSIIYCSLTLLSLLIYCAGICSELSCDHMGAHPQPLWHFCFWPFLGLGHESSANPQLRALLDHQHNVGAHRGVAKNTTLQVFTIIRLQGIKLYSELN